MKNRYEPSPEEVQALVDDELPPETAARVRSALPGSPRALAELDECLQMAALAQELRAAAGAPDRPADASDPQSAAAKPVGIFPWCAPPPRARPRAVIAIVASLSLGAAAGLALWTEGPGDPGQGGGREPAGVGPVGAFAGALAARRTIAARLSWPPADRYRPYDTARLGPGNPRSAEAMSFELLGRIEKLGDPRAVPAAQILLGNTGLAARRLGALPRSPDVDSDRAAIALVEGEPEQAVLAAATALESDPRHVQAAWNRALALERLGLPVTAAEAFEAVAAAGEPGWSAEASERAASLRVRFERRRTAWKSAKEAGAKLVAGDLPDAATVAAYPGLLRLHFYDAVRAAPSAERVRALRPLAEALDASSGGRHLTDTVDRIARSDFGSRGPLAARYAALVRRELTDRAKVDALLVALRAAGQDDMLLGALVHAGATPGRPDEPRLAEYVALARATGDPWFELKAIDDQAWRALWNEKFASAQSLLGPAAMRCERGAAMASLCLDIFRLLTHAYVSLHRPDAASRTLERAREIARATGNTERETELLKYSHLVVALADDTSSALMALDAAYLDEWTRQSKNCADARVAREWRAIAFINQHRLDAARREMAGDTTPCDAPFTSARAFVLAQLLARGGDDAAVQGLRRDIAALRRSDTAPPGELAFLDHIEGRLLVVRSPAEGQALLRRAIAAAAVLPGDIKAEKARSYGYSVLVEDAVERGDGAEALALLAEDRRLPAPDRCALGAAGETSSVFVARAADGRVQTARLAREPGEPAGARAVPPAVPAHLAGCETVDVFARQPYYGRPDLLPRDMAWQFRTGAPTREPRSRPGRAVVVANIDPPPGLDLAPLRPVPAAPGAILIEGPAATPDRVLAAAADASFLEIHAHGLLGRDESDTSLLILAPDGRGRYTLGGTEIRRARLRGAPVVMLAACHASAIGGAFHSTWGLADAFATAGARAVIASPDPIQDAGASAFFASLRARIAGGQPPAAALRAARMVRNEPSERSWIDRLVVFR